MQRFTIAADKKLAPGKSKVRFECDYDDAMAQGGSGRLFVNDKKLVEGRVERPQPIIFSADETAHVGIDLATPTLEAIGSEAKSRFTGKISSVTVDVRQEIENSKSPTTST